MSNEEEADNDWVLIDPHEEEEEEEEEDDDWLERWLQPSDAFWGIYDEIFCMETLDNFGELIRDIVYYNDEMGLNFL